MGDLYLNILENDARFAENARKLEHLQKWATEMKGWQKNFVRFGRNLAEDTDSRRQVVETQARCGAAANHPVRELAA